MLCNLDLCSLLTGLLISGSSVRARQGALKKSKAPQALAGLFLFDERLIDA